MTKTNKAHKEAVERVKDKLEKSNAFSGKVKFDERSGVDLYATGKNGKLYFFTVIKGTRKNSESVYSAVNSATWQFINDNHTKDLFFISEIATNGQLSYYVYTPTEMWCRSNVPYVQLKCNPLKEFNTLVEFKDTIDITPPIGRYKGEDDMLKRLEKLPSILDQLKKIKE